MKPALAPSARYSTATRRMRRAAASRRPGAWPKPTRLASPGARRYPTDTQQQGDPCPTTRLNINASTPRPAHGAAWKQWGPYLSERQWGTVREDYSADGTAWDYFPHDHARSRAYRWGEDGIAGFCDDAAAPVPVAGAVERPRSDPEGTPVRPDQRRGQSRRGRQGALLLPRRHADALLPEDALQVSAARVSLRAAGRGKPPPRHRRSRNSSCSTPASSTTTATSTCSSNTPRPRPDDILMRVTAHNRGPDAAPTAPAAAALVPQHLVVEARSAAEPVAARRPATARIAVDHAELGTLFAVRRRRAPSCCSATTRPTCAGCSAQRCAEGFFKDALPRLRRRRRHDGRQSRHAPAPRPRRCYQFDGPGRRLAHDPRCG